MKPGPITITPVGGDNLGSPTLCWQASGMGCESGWYDRPREAFDDLLARLRARVERDRMREALGREPLPSRAA